MAMVELNTGCITCLQPSGIHFLNVQSTENTSIEEALKKHFWFTETDFQLATICQCCWEQVNNFHRFYISVEDLYRNRLAAAVIVKPEPQAVGYTYQEDARLRKPDDEAKPLVYFNLDQPEDDDIPMVSIEPASEAKPEPEVVRYDPPLVVLPESSSTQPVHETRPQLEYYNIEYSNAEEPNQDQGDSERSFNEMDEQDSNDFDDSELALSKKHPQVDRKNLAGDEYIKQHVRYICKDCGQETETFSEYRKHAQHSHGIKKPTVECCGRNYRTKYALLQHVQVANNPDVFRCPHCKRRFELRDLLRNHVNKVHNKKFKCDRCPKSFVKQHLFEEHMETHTKIWRCNECTVALPDEQSLCDHIREYHTEAKMCDVCRFILPSSDALITHYMKEHKKYWNEHKHLFQEDYQSEEDDLIEWSLAESNVTNVELYQDLRLVLSDCREDGLLERYGITEEHLEIATTMQYASDSDEEDEELVVPIGSKRASDQSDAKENNPDGSRYAPARQISQSFEDDYIRQHVELKCKICGHESKSFYRFKQHALITHDIRNPFLECCGKKFPERYMLFRHVQQLQDPSTYRRKFKCTRCPQTLGTQYKLNVHMESHKREIYNCTRCHRVYSDVQTLGSHVITCWSEASRCDICRLVLPSKSALDEHNTKEHSGIQTIPYDPNTQLVELRHEQSYVAKEVSLPDESQQEAAESLLEELSTYPSNKPNVETDQVGSFTIMSANVGPSDEFLEKVNDEKRDSDQSDDDSSDCPEYTPVKRLVNAIDIASPAADKYIRKHVKFVCEECGENSKTFSQFKQHALKEHGIKSAYVKCCGKKFFKKYNLMQHVQILENPDAFSCTHCNVSYKYREGLLKHLRTVHSSDWTRFKCDKCPETFADGNLAKLHMQEHKSCKCPLCGQRFPDVNALRAHAQLTHPSAILCYACKQVLPSQEALEAHKVQEHGMEPSVAQDTLQSQDSEEESLLCWATKTSTSASGSVVEPSQLQQVPLVTKREPGVPEDDCLVQPEPECSISTEIDIKPTVEDVGRKESEHSEAELSNVETGKADRPAKRKRRTCGLKSNIHNSVEDDYIRKHVKYICKQCGVESKTFFGFKRHAHHVHGIKWSFLVCCGKEYAFRAQLYEHVQLVNNPDVFRCQECKKSFKNKPGFVRHMDKFHDSSDRRFKCDLCPKSFTYNYLYQEHREQHVNPTEEGWQCQHCEKIFPGANHLDKHIYNVHREAPKLTCDVCSQAFRVEAWLQRHKLKHATQKCQLCPKELPDRRSLRTHARSVHPDAMVCSVCKHVLPTRQALQEHKVREHGAKQPIKQQSQPIADSGLIDEEGLPLEGIKVVNVDLYQEARVELTDCLEEGLPEGYSIQSVIKSEDLENDTEDLVTPMDDKHNSEQYDDDDQEDEDEDDVGYAPAKRKRLEAGLTNSLLENEYIRGHVKYICEHCGHESQSFSLYKQHSLWAHGNKSPAVNCCGRKYYKKWILLQHVQNIADPDGYRCQQCRKNYTNEEGYRRHMMRYHSTDGYKFQCERCPKRYCYKHELKKHMVDHLGQDNQSWKCRYCEKLLSSAHSLNNHIKREHDAVPEFICDVCSKGFNIETWLVEHKKLKHQKMQCLFCPEQFDNGKNYRAHVKEIHPNEQMPMICNLCKQVLPTRDALQAHKLQEHGSEKRSRQKYDNEDDCLEESLDSNAEKESDVDLLVVKTEAEVQYIPEPAVEPMKSQSESEGSDYELQDDPDDMEYTPEQDTNFPARSNTPESRLKQDNYIREHVKYICERCGHESKTFLSFVKHAQKRHCIESPALKCCGKEFRKKHQLFQHVQQLRDPVTYRCEECDRSFCMKAYYRRHLRRKHSKDRYKFKCNRCPKVLATQYSLALHKQNHEGQDNLSWRCQHCDKLQVSRRALQKHMNKIHPDAPKFVCDACSREFRVEIIFQQHMQRHKKLRCILCPEQFPNIKKLHIHMRTLHPSAGAPYVCSYCRDVLPSKDALKAHKAQEHEYQCNTTDEEDSDDGSNSEWPSEKADFAQDQNQQVSSSVNSEPKMGKNNRLDDGLLGCSYSKSSANTEQSGTSSSGIIESSSVALLKQPIFEKVLELLSEDETDLVEVQHVLERPTTKLQLPQHHAGIKDQNISLSTMRASRHQSSECEICGASFQSRDGLEYHLTHWHVDMPEYNCNVCSKGFRMKSWLEKHKRTHEKPALPKPKLKCDQCGERFPDESLLEGHVQDHEGWEFNLWNKRFDDPPDFICDVCSKAFRVEQFFQQHKLTHEQTMVQCGHCPQKFGDAKSMRAHVRQMHLGAKIVCKICNLDFPNANALQDHKVRKHGVKPINQKCPYCRESFSGRELVDRHVATVHNGMNSGSLSEFLDL